jgi:ribosomal-protein-alanine N-acetyltransferase
MEDAVEVTLRQYRAEDLEAMYALDIVCFEPAFRFSRRAMRRFAEARGAIPILAEIEGGELAGFGIAQMEARVGYVVTLDVAPAWRRHGLARRLMAEMEARAAAAGAGTMELHVFAGNAGAMRFYEGIAYGRVGMVEGFYGRGLDALVYAKRLQD